MDPLDLPPTLITMCGVLIYSRIRTLRLRVLATPFHL